MFEDYRGYFICLVHNDGWRAEVIERDSGTLLPTMVTASPDEGMAVCAGRARQLVDLYLEAEATVNRQHRADAAGRHAVPSRP